jgi:hypothetical protein
VGGNKMKTLTKICLTILFGFILVFSFNSDEAKAEKVKVIWGKIEVQEGQIGKVTFLKDSNIYKTGKSGKPVLVKNVKKGTEMGVYQVNKKLLSGAYVLSGSTYVKISENVKYELLPANKKEIVGKDRIWILSETVQTSTGYHIGIPNFTEAIIIDVKTDKEDKYLRTLKLKVGSKYYYLETYTYSRMYSYIDYNPFVTFKSWSKSVWKNVLARKVSIGMDIQMVEFAWGRPDDINEYTSVNGTTHQWIYGDVLKGATYLYFDDDFILTSWQDY